MPEITQVLNALERGETASASALLPLVYEQLRGLAAQKLAAEAPGHTLQPTALVHEAWLRVSHPSLPQWQGRGHFFAAAAEAMRRILVDAARRRNAAKRGAAAVHLDVDELEIALPDQDDDQLLALHEALDKFAAREPRKADLVKLRYFVGLSFDEAAIALGIAVPTAKQWWSYSRAWLAVEMQRKI